MYVYVFIYLISINIYTHIRYTWALLWVLFEVRELDRDSVRILGRVYQDSIKMI